MAQLKLSYDELTAIIHLAAQIGTADGQFTDEELIGLVGYLTDVFDFEGQEDLLKSYLKDASNMDSGTAIELLSGVGDAEKQFASNLFVKVIAADGNADEAEKELYFKLMDICSLPDHNLTANPEASAITPIFPVIHYKNVFNLYLDGEVLYPQIAEDTRNKVFELFDAETLSFWRNSSGLNFLNDKLKLDGKYLIMIFNKDNNIPNKIGTLLADNEPVNGPILFAWEDDKKMLYGFESKEDVKYLLELLDSITEGMLLLDNSKNSSLAQKNFQAALSNLENL